jgi:hypothetical protein
MKRIHVAVENPKQSIGFYSALIKFLCALKWKSAEMEVT